MAEILISLTIIGIIAAITLPSLVGNIKEKSWATQRKALYSRMSQAISMMPSLNGYGVVMGENDQINESATAQNAAHAFITNGLSKVLQINNICNNQHFKDCGITDKYRNFAGKKLPMPVNLHKLNETFSLITKSDGASYSTSNTNAVAFETKNGESIVAYYNPNCIAEDDAFGFSQAIMCVNFIYDLNGKKGPNAVSKDMGVVTVFYSVDSLVVAPIPTSTTLAQNGVQFNNATKACTAKNPNSRLPNINELSSLSINRSFFETPTTNDLWSNSIRGTDIWVAKFYDFCIDISAY